MTLRLRSAVAIAVTVALAFSPVPVLPGSSARILYTDSRVLDRGSDAEVRGAVPGAISDDPRILPPVAASPPGIPCYSSTATSPVVKVFYLYPRGTTNKLAARRTAIREAIAYADLTFALSAQRSGGVRHVRWAMTAACTLAITAVGISPTLSFDGTRRYLISKGLLKSTQKAVAFREGRPCNGLGDRVADDRAAASNPNNRGGTLAWVQVQPCLDEASDPMDRAYVYGSLGFGVAHELAHSLGAVQRSAPHATAGGHCTDGHDPLCYDDGTGAEIQVVCGATIPQLFDCGNDDYFDTNPAAGSYLATHWNIARSRFLATRETSRWDRLPRAAVAIANVTEGATLDEGARVTFDVTRPADGDEIAAVALLVDGVVTGVDRAAPFNIPFGATRAVPGQPAVLQAVAFDRLGRQASSPPVRVLMGSVNLGTGVLAIVSPPENAVVNGVFGVVVSAPSASGMTSATVSVNGMVVGTVTAPGWTLTVDPEAIGANVGDLDITVAADDGSGLETTTRVFYLPT